MPLDIYKKDDNFGSVRASIDCSSIASLQQKVHNVPYCSARSNCVTHPVAIILLDGIHEEEIPNKHAESPRDRPSRSENVLQQYLGRLIHTWHLVCSKQRHFNAYVCDIDIEPQVLVVLAC